jgi:CHASE2 domain-containing sensor protein
MNPALLLVALLAGTSLLLLGVLSAVFGWLPLVPAVVLAGVGAIVEAISAVAFARSRRRGTLPGRKER